MQDNLKQPQNATIVDSQARRGLFAKMSRDAEDRMIREDRAQILPRSKRERTWRHYQRTLTLLLSALDVPSSCQELVADLISILGFDVEDWAKIYDLDLAEHVICTSKPVSPKNEDYKALLQRTADRKRKQREALLEYQAEPGNPLIIEFQAPYVAEEKKRRPEYKLPIAGQVREIVRRCPVGAGDKRLRATIQEVSEEYLSLFEGAAKGLKKKQKHSPDSDLARAATVAEKALKDIETDLRRGHVDAILAFREKFAGLSLVIREAFGIEVSNLDLVQNAQKQAFLESEKSDNSNSRADLHFWASGNISRPRTSEIGHDWGEIAHVSINKNVGDFDQGEAPRCDFRQSAPDLQQESQRGDEIRALEAFRSVGCENFEWFYLTDQTKKQGEYHRTSGAELAEEISAIVQDAETYGDSCIVRVRGPVLQLDDCEGLVASLLQPFALAVFETSRANYQVWLAFKDPEDKPFVAERIFNGVRAIIPSEINTGAGGAIRWPGSINQKPERNGWRVRIHSINPGRFVTPSELEDAGLLVEPMKIQWNYQADGTPGDWPDYQVCLESKTKDGKTDRSAADAQFTCLALKRRIGPEDIAKKLAQISDKAKKSGRKYIERTIANGMKYLGLEAAK